MGVVTSTCGFLMTLLVHGCMGQVSIDTEPQNVAGILGTTQEVLLQCRMSTYDGSSPTFYTWSVDYKEISIYICGDKVAEHELAAYTWSEYKQEIYQNDVKQEYHELADYVELDTVIPDQWTNYGLVVTTADPVVAARYACSCMKTALVDNRAADVLLVENHPHCSQDKDIYIEGDTATISCEVKYHGRWGPGMRLTGPGQLVNNYGMNLVKWSRKLKVGPDNNGETFTCESEYGGPPNPGPGDATNVPDLVLNDCTKTIVVEYAPRNTKIEQDSASVGDTLTCVSTANPAVEESGFEWTVDDETSTGSTFMLENRHQGELNISCCATSPIGGPDCDEKISMPIFTTTSTTTTTTTTTTSP